MLRILLTLSIACLLLPQSNMTATPRRMALIIANSEYESLKRLPEAAVEAAIIEKVLKNSGFEIRVLPNVQGAPAAARSATEELSRKVEEFTNELEPNDVCVVYYSGYAVHKYAGPHYQNYFLPIDFKGSEVSPQRAYLLSNLLQLLRDKCSVKIFLLETGRAVAGMAGGVAAPVAPLQDKFLDTLLAFSLPPEPPRTDMDKQESSATSRSRVARDVNGPLPRIGRFTEVISKNLCEPNVDLYEVEKVVRSEAAGYVANNVKEFYCLPGPPTGTEKVNSNKDGLMYVWIRDGKFKMGCVPGDSKCHKHELPQHKVVISKGFWLGQTEVRRDAYERFVDDFNKEPKNKNKKKEKPKPTPANDIDSKQGDLPVVRVSWHDARDYCTWAGGRLPTEAEWEYAARAGKDDQIYPFNNDESSREHANFSGKVGKDHYHYAAPVGLLTRSPWSLYDMAGNVWEWVSDFYSETYYRDCEKGVADPQGPSNDNGQHVKRGGSFRSDPKEHLRISYREAANRDWDNIGFRCVLDGAKFVIRGRDLVDTTGQPATVRR